MIDKIWATYWAIACGVGLVQHIFHSEEQPWSWVGALIYFLLFLATLYQIKAKQSLVEWLWKKHKKRKAWKADPNNWSV
jgi:hypothetical protein